MIKEYQTVREVFGPIVLVEGIEDAAYNETVEIILPNGERKKGQVLESSKGLAAVQVFGVTTGLDTKETRIRFSGETLRLPVSEEMRKKKSTLQALPSTPTPAKNRTTSSKQAFRLSTRSTPSCEGKSYPSFPLQDCRTTNWQCKSPANLRCWARKNRL